MEQLTKRQQEVYDYLRNYIIANNYSPTFQELCDHFEVTSKCTMYKHVSAIIRRGLLKRKRYGRFIELP